MTCLVLISEDEATGAVTENGLTDPKAQRITAVGKLGGLAIVGGLAAYLIFVFQTVLLEEGKGIHEFMMKQQETLKMCITLASDEEE